mmetsp:Transcript_16046/g.34912  ORF Transcript_16046/g.34912 Transcript_16046/m.34912 type:complete len:665 (+) Transcript_16046:1-1995(+)
MVLSLSVSAAHAVSICKQRLKRGMFALDADEDGRQVTGCQLTPAGNTLAVVVDDGFLLVVRWGEFPQRIEEVFSHVAKDERIMCAHVTDTHLLTLIPGVVQVRELPDEQLVEDDFRRGRRGTSRFTNINLEDTSPRATQSQCRPRIVRRQETLKRFGMLVEENENLQGWMSQLEELGHCQELHNVMRDMQTVGTPLESAQKSFGSAAIPACTGTSLYDGETRMLVLHDISLNTLSLVLLPAALFMARAPHITVPLAPHWVLYCGPPVPSAWHPRIAVRQLLSESRLVIASDSLVREVALEWDWGEAVRRLEERVRKDQQQKEGERVVRADHRATAMPMGFVDLRSAAKTSIISATIRDRDDDEASSRTGTRDGRGSVVSASLALEAEDDKKSLHLDDVDEMGEDQATSSVHCSRLHLAPTAEEAAEVLQVQFPGLPPPSARHWIRGPSRTPKQDFRNLSCIPPPPQPTTRSCTAMSWWSGSTCEPIETPIDYSDAIRSLPISRGSGMVRAIVYRAHPLRVGKEIAPPLYLDERAKQLVQARQTTACETDQAVLALRRAGQTTRSLAMKRRKAPLVDPRDSRSAADTSMDILTCRGFESACPSGLVRSPSRAPRASEGSGRLHDVTSRSVFAGQEQSYAKTHREFKQCFPSLPLPRLSSLLKPKR